LHDQSFNVQSSDARAEAMKRIGVAAALAWTAVGLCTRCSPAEAQFQTPPELRNPNIAVDYYEPRNEGYLPRYRTLQDRQVLEKLSQFLAPVHWPKKLRLIAKQCQSGAPRQEPEVYYNAVEYSLNLCYQWLATINDFGRPNPKFASKPQVIVGGVVGILLHEAGRAVFDMHKVPRLGSDEDAADQIATFVGLQFGEEVARTVTKGTYWVWDTYDVRLRDRNEQYKFSGRASVAPQRMRNTACIAYGRDPVTFKELAGSLSQERAAGCADEYQQIARAFDKTVKKHVNLELMKKVQSMTWLTAEDLK
jgi:hypothetical protein